MIVLLLPKVVGNRVEQSVFSGVTRNSVSFNEIESLLNGVQIKKETPRRFFRSLKHLQLKIKPLVTTLMQNNNKILINNTYFPRFVSITNYSDYRQIFYLLKQIYLRKYRKVVVK